MSGEPETTTRHDVALVLERLSGRVDLLAYKVEVLSRDRGEFVPRPELERVVTEVATLKRELDEVLPDVREMIQADDQRRERREETLRAVIKWAVLGLLAFLVLSVLYAVGLGPAPLQR